MAGGDFTNPYYSTAPTIDSQPTAAGTVMFQALASAYGQLEHGKAVRNMAEFNAEMAESQARDARRRGRERSFLSRARTKKVAGAQKAALAAQGIRVDTGSALDVRLETETIGDYEVTIIKNNGMREALGFKAQATSARLAGRFAESKAKDTARTTLLTGGLRSAGYYQNWIEGTT